ncbi:thiol:disulfide interchange protein DsbC precursor [bacterium BMS3Abin07]|nr:thiol:disulfide interchange protein DsbC precursor [bacterium BMS3Abin07]GBE33395.1 thiol:disulfide interchange protein DsbC precursor [bacterium BMS3Bbin05]HDH06720.1 hypothetical protein [Nitrospirota bacterium]HDO22617.1 hypothetical protein [Nitrospirota bacterium]
MKQVVKKRKDIVFFLKMFPLVKIHPQSYDKAKSIVCEKSNDKAIKMLEDVYAKKAIPKASCNTTAIDDNIKLGQKLGTGGTPTLIFSDGRVKSGAMNADQLIQLIDK